MKVFAISTVAAIIIWFGALSGAARAMTFGAAVVSTSESVTLVKVTRKRNIGVMGMTRAELRNHARVHNRMHQRAARERAERDRAR